VAPSDLGADVGVRFGGDGRRRQCDRDSQHGRQAEEKSAGRRSHGVFLRKGAMLARSRSFVKEQASKIGLGTSRQS